MLSIVLAPENFIFSSALFLMLLIGIVEACGLGAIGGSAGALENDYSLLSWLSVGRLPFSIVLILFLAAFGLSGFAIQHIATSWAGGSLSTLPAAAATAPFALLATRLLGGAVARVLPTDETSAVSLDSLVGRRGSILVGVASQRSPTRARVRDAYGQSHYVLVEPHVPEAKLHEGDEILLIGRDAGSFLAIAITPTSFLQEK